MTTKTGRLPKSFVDADGTTWYRHGGADHYHTSVVTDCRRDGCSNDLTRVRQFGPLTDFVYDEPAPEPAKFEKCWTCANGVGWYCFCDEPAPEPTPRKPEHGCGNCEGVDPKSCVMDHDTQPEKGDRVRVTHEAEYVNSRSNGGHYVMADDWGYLVPADAEITVIERAAPKVPEEPEVGSVVEIDGGKRFVHRYDETCGWVATNGSAKYSWDELHHDFGTLYEVERGAVIS